MWYNYISKIHKEYKIDDDENVDEFKRIALRVGLTGETLDEYAISYLYHQLQDGDNENNMDTVYSSDGFESVLWDAGTIGSKGESELETVVDEYVGFMRHIEHYIHMIRTALGNDKYKVLDHDGTFEHSLYLAISKYRKMLNQPQQLPLTGMEIGNKYVNIQNINDIIHILNRTGYDDLAGYIQSNMRLHEKLSLKSILFENVKGGKFIVYHGTDVKFNKFNFKKSAQGIVWFTNDKQKIISKETGAGGHGYIVTAEVTINNPVGWDKYQTLLLAQYKGEGFDGAILEDGGAGTFDYFVLNPRQIKILKVEKIPISENANGSTEEYRKSWLERHKAIVENGRLLAYHGTPIKNLKSIKQNGFKYKTYFSLRPEYSKQIASRYHDTPEDKVVVIKVWLPLDAIDFVMSDIYSTRVIDYKETI